MIDELIEWLKTNKIEYKEVDNEVLTVAGLGDVYYEDTEQIKSIFRTNSEGDVEFNLIEDATELANEGIYYIAFRFGDNFYYYDTREEFKLNILKYIGERERTQHTNENYCNLGSHTAFELLNGSFLCKDWVKKAKYLGHKSIGICDKNTMAACYNLQKECEAEGITPVFGYSLDFICNGEKVGAKVYVQTQEGLRHLLRIQKDIMVDNPEQATIQYEDLIELSEGIVIVLDKYSAQWIKDNTDKVNELIEHFDNVFFQVDFTEYKAERIDVLVLNSMATYFKDLYNSTKVRPILISDAYYLDKDDCNNKIVLNKIATGAAHAQSNEQYYKDIDEQYEYFKNIFSDKWDVDVIFKECCDNIGIITSGAKARFENTRNFMPAYDLTEDEKKKYGTAHNMFCQLLEEGLEKLVPKEKQKQYRELIS